jgi:hypothetical protein
MSLFLWTLACYSREEAPPASTPQPASALEIVLHEPVLATPPPPPPPPPPPAGPRLSLHPLRTDGPALEVAVAQRCKGDLGLAAEISLDDLGLLPQLTRACVFVGAEEPRVCCPDQDPDSPELHPGLEAYRELERALPWGPRARIRVRAPGPVLIYAYWLEDVETCFAYAWEGVKTRNDLVFETLEVTEPTEIWLQLDSVGGHPVAGVLAGASASELRQQLETVQVFSDGELRFGIPDVPEGPRHAWAINLMGQCCCGD